jgi:hypothetical protein
MQTSTRWTLVAFLIGFSAAYSMWGGSDAAAQRSLPPVSASGQPIHPDDKQFLDEHGAASIVPNALPGAQSVLRCKPFRIDFGDVPIDDSRSQTIAVENPGSTPVKILEAQPSCGCVSAKLELMLIEPGKSVPLTVTFRASGARPAGLTLMLATDEPGHPRLVIPIEGRTRQEFTIEPGLLKFGKLHKKESKTLTTRLIRTDGKPFEITRIMDDQKEFASTFKPANAEKNAYDITVVATALKTGAAQSTVAIMVEHPSVHSVALHLLLDVPPEVTCAPPFLRSDRAADKTVPPFETVIKRETPGQLEIESIADQDKLPLTFSTERIDDASVRVKIQLTGEYTKVPPFGQFNLKTNADADLVPLPYRVTLPVPGKKN